MSDHSQDAKGSEIPASNTTGDDMSLDDIIKSLAIDPQGVICLGDDGVLRSIDGEHKTVVDAHGLSPAQIKEFFDGFKSAPPGLGMNVSDGRGVSHEDMFHPPEGSLPPKATPEKRAATLRYNEELKKKGITCDIPKPSGVK